MFGISRKRGIRRQRARQLRAESSESAWEVYSRRIGLWPTLMAGVFFVLALLIGTYGERALPYSVGQKVAQPITARVEFAVDDPKQTDANRQSARESTPNYYRVNVEAVERIASDLTSMFEAAQAESFEKYEQLGAAAPWAQDRQAYEYLHAAKEPQGEAFTRALEGLRSALQDERTARPTTAEDRDSPPTAGFVMVQRYVVDAAEGAGPDLRQERVETLKLIQIANVAALEGRAEVLADPFGPVLRPAVRAVLLKELREHPLLVYDQKRTLEAMAAAEQATPPAVKHYEKGKPFVFPRFEETSSGDRIELGLTPADIELLKFEAAAYQTFLGGTSAEARRLVMQRLYERVGVGMVLGVLTVTLFAYVGRYQARVLEVRSRTVALLVLLLGGLVIVRFVDTRLPFTEFGIVPVLLTASVLTLAYPERFAAGVTMLLIIVVALITRAGVGLMVTLFAAAYVTAYCLHDIRTRTRIITVGIGTGALVFFLQFAFGLIGGQQAGFILPKAGIAAGSTVLAALVFQGALPFVERVFRVATSLTLLEWRDANRPLLQRLAREAAGTYNHSLVLATMAETACEAVGANGLLAHVGALYHDVGKISKAEYFAENQEASINRHESLAPTMSMLIILGHVKDGIELAKEYGLPRVLHSFIAEHHGTTVVRYFHHMASEKQARIARGKHDRDVSEFEFRYPGPKPQTIETAVLMLCDGTEGAVRALPEPTAGRIETTVHQILEARLRDGQFDDCDITLRQLHLVEEALVKSLCRFHHGRVAYPKEAPRKAETREETPPGPDEQRQVG